MEACFLRVGAQRQHLRRNGYTYITMDESQSSLSPNETTDGTVGRLFPVHQTTPAGLGGNCCGRPNVVNLCPQRGLVGSLEALRKKNRRSSCQPQIEGGAVPGGWGGGEYSSSGKRGARTGRGVCVREWLTARCGCRSRLPPPGEHGSDEIPGHRLGGAGISRAHTRAQFGPRPVS